MAFNLGTILKAYKKFFIIGLFGLLAAAILYFTLPPAQFVKVINYSSIFFMGIMVIMLIRSFRKEKSVNKISQVIAIITPAVTLAFYLIFLSKHKPGWLFIGFALCGGMIFGSIWSKYTKLYIKEQKVFGKNTVWWLAFWGMSFMLVKSMTLWGKSNGINLSLIVMSFTTGKAFGIASGILKQMNILMGKIPKTHSSASQKVLCEECGFQLEPDVTSCEMCGNPASPDLNKEKEQQGLEISESPKFCGQCGNKIAPDDRFCDVCGFQIIT